MENATLHRNYTRSEGLKKAGTADVVECWERLQCLGNSDCSTVAGRARMHDWRATSRHHVACCCTKGLVAFVNNPDCKNWYQGPGKVTCNQSAYNAYPNHRLECRGSIPH